MKITDKRKKKKMFYEIVPSTLFECDGTFFIKGRPLPEDRGNAISLSNGSICYIEDTRIINVYLYPEPQLIIEDKS